MTSKRCPWRRWSLRRALLALAADVVAAMTRATCVRLATTGAVFAIAAAFLTGLQLATGAFDRHLDRRWRVCGRGQNARGGSGARRAPPRRNAHPAPPHRAWTPPVPPARRQRHRRTPSGRWVGRDRLHDGRGTGEHPGRDERAPDGGHGYGRIASGRHTDEEGAGGAPGAGPDLEGQRGARRRRATRCPSARRRHRRARSRRRRPARSRSPWPRRRSR